MKKRAAYAILVLLLAALYVYFLGTPWVAGLTGIAPRTISLVAGLAVVLFGIAAMMLGRLVAQRNRGGGPDIDSRH
jgi:biotin transporter BioY